MHSVCVYSGKELAEYNFGDEHPFGPGRMDAFLLELDRQGAIGSVCLCQPQRADRDALISFHTSEYIDRVERLSRLGVGMLDHGDTPAFAGMFAAASTVVGSVLDAIARIMSGRCRQAFIPIAGLHHARRDSAAGFCVFNDCGVAIEQLRLRYGLQKLAYVDIDAHHGDGVYYGFATDPDLCIVDAHEDGRHLYPGTGARDENGVGDAVATKLNIPLPPGADDQLFSKIWPEAEDFIEQSKPEFILLQCGADSVDGDPLTHLRLSKATHTMVTQRLIKIAEQYCDGRLLIMGGGGYNLRNIGETWAAVVMTLIEHAPGDL